MQTIDKAWLQASGVKAESPEELQDLTDRVQERIRRQLYALMPGELTKTKLAAYDKMWDTYKDTIKEADWLEKNLPTYAKFAARIQQTVSDEIQAATYKKALIKNWSKPAAPSASTKPAQSSSRLKVDEDWLQAQGITVKDKAVLKELAKLAYGELEIRVGNRLANTMTDAQLDEFETYVSSKDDDGAFDWMEQNLPDYKVVVQEEYAALGKEIKAAKDKVALIRGWSTAEPTSK